jgi:hypothetical protein
LELIPGLNKSLKNTASVHFTSIQFVAFASILPISGTSRVRSASIFRICGINRLRFASIFPICGINRIRSASIFLICRINRIRFASIFLRCRINRVRFALTFTSSGISRFFFASISKTKPRSKLRSAFVSLSLTLLFRVHHQYQRHRFQIFLIDDFFHLPKVSTTPVANHELQISP